MHCWPALQAGLHAGVSGTHAPSWQRSPAPHCTPQLPQLIGSVDVSLQPPAQASVLLGHTQTLFEQAPAPQSQPQPPQFLGSARPSMHTPPQFTWPGVAQPTPVVMNGAAPPALTPLPSEPVAGSPLQAPKAKSTSPRMENRLNQHLFARIVEQVTRSN
jgi:hypothetical protein